jgi:hypothetical protein
MKKRIFICYSHEDEEWKNKLEAQLNVLRSEGIEPWSDNDIIAGENTIEVIKDAINMAEAVIIMISRDLLNSDSIVNEQIPLLFERHKKEGLAIFLVIVRPCPYESIHWLQNIRPYPRRVKALSKLKEEYEIEDELTTIVNEVDKILKIKEKERIKKYSQSNAIEKKVLSKNIVDSNIDDVADIFIIEIPCDNNPFSEFIANENIYLLSDGNEWLNIDINKKCCTLLPFRSTCSSAVIDSNQSLFVGLYKREVLQLKKNNWIDSMWDCSVLSMVSTPHGIIVGDENGKLSHFKQIGNLISMIVIDEPVIKIVCLKNGIVILGSNGGVWTTQWPIDEHASLKKANLNDFFQVYNIFNSIQPDKVILMKDNKLALFDFHSNKISLTSETFSLSIREICINPLNQNNFLLLSDEGKLLLLSHDFMKVKSIDFPNEKNIVSGIRAISSESFLAWTKSGNLYIIQKNAVYNKTDYKDVVMAFVDNNKKGVYIIQKTDNKLQILYKTTF